MENYFSLKTLLAIVTGCVVSLDQRALVFEVLDFMNRAFVAPLDYEAVLKRCRAEILRQYPGLLVENVTKDRVAYFTVKEQERILIEMREKFKEILVNDSLLILPLESEG